VYAGTDYTFPVLLFSTFAISQQHALLWGHRTLPYGPFSHNPPIYVCILSLDA
jgi:hypothetical protein